MKYRVNWQQIVTQSWSGVIEAASEEEALYKLRTGESIEEEEVTDEDTIRIQNEEVEGEEE